MAERLNSSSQIVLPHSAVQRYPRNSSSEQECPVRLAVLFRVQRSSVRTCSQYPGSAHLTSEYRPPTTTDGAARSEFDRGAHKEPFARVRPPRRPSRPKQHWDFDPAEKELTPLPVLRYGFGHRKRWFKNPIRATIALTFEGALLARSYCPVVGIRIRSLIFGRQEGF